MERRMGIRRELEAFRLACDSSSLCGVSQLLFKSHQTVSETLHCHPHVWNPAKPLISSTQSSQMSLCLLLNALLFHLSFRFHMWCHPCQLHYSPRWVLIFAPSMRPRRSLFQLFSRAILFATPAPSKPREFTNFEWNVHWALSHLYAPTR